MTNDFLNYILKEVFLVAPTDCKTNTETLGLAPTFSDAVHYIDNHMNFQIMPADVSVYHGAIIPATFIPKKVTRFMDLWLLYMDQKNTTSVKHGMVEYCEIEGEVYEVRPFGTINGVASFIKSKMELYKYTIEDLYLFVGYMASTADVINSSDLNHNEMTHVRSVIREARLAMLKYGTAQDDDDADDNFMLYG